MSMIALGAEIANSAATEFSKSTAGDRPLAPVLQLERICQTLNHLQESAATHPQHYQEIEQVLRAAAPLSAETRMALVLDRSTKWIVRTVPEVVPGQRVKIVGTQDVTMLDHVGSAGVVVPFRGYAVPVAAKVRIDGYSLDMIWPLGCLKPVVSPAATRLDSLVEQYEALSQRRQHVLAQGEIINRKPEIFATVKKSRKVCGNVQSETGAKGYAFLTVVQNGRRKRFSIPPSELGRYEAAYARGLEVRRIDRELKKLSRQIDRQSAIANGLGTRCVADSVGKQAGQLDLYCTRDGRSEWIDSEFSFVVFRWQPKANGGLKRSKVLKRFPVAARATPQQVEEVRQKAIAFMNSLS